MYISNKVEQIDIFPTIVDIMGIAKYECPVSRTSYRGLGRSLLHLSDIHDSI